jgi:ketosteroid isomerase-like protein
MASAAVLVLLAGAIWAGRTSQTNEDPRIRNVMDDFFTLAKRQDWDAVGRLMAPEFEIYTDNAEVYTKDSYIRLLKSDNLQLNRMELYNDRVTVASDGSLAWMTYRGRFETIERGRPVTTETAETMLFRRDGDRWLIARGHASIRNVSPAR